MYDGMGETYGIRVLYSGLESRRYIGLSSCQFFFLLLLRQCLRRRERPMRKDDEHNSKSFSLE